ncbi:MAG: sporulation protein YabP [Oscillospiraceae bacterium]|nr:sporulation protein YabP [Oscillospiraceae bacterium]
MNTERAHHAILENRERLLLSGVTETVSFDDRAVILYTVQGELTVLGRDLQLHALNTETGELEISGRIAALKYGDRDRKASANWMGRLLR